MQKYLNLSLRKFDFLHKRKEACVCILRKFKSAFSISLANATTSSCKNNDFCEENTYSYHIPSSKVSLWLLTSVFSVSMINGALTHFMKLFFPYPLERLGNYWFSHIFRRCRKRPVARNRLICNCFWIFCVQGVSNCAELRFRLLNCAKG